jgi:hypothetical protein
VQSQSLQIGGTTVIDSSRNITNINTISSGSIIATGDSAVGAGGNISMSAASAGQLRIFGAGYTGSIALNGTTMAIYHNSSSRSLTLGTNETARIIIGGGGGVSFNNNSLTSVGTITSTALFSNNISTSADKIGNIKIARVNGAISSIDTLDTFIYSKTDGSYTGGTKPAGSHNGTAILSFQTHTDNYYTQLALSTNTNDLFIRSANNSASYGSYEKLLKENTAISVTAVNGSSNNASLSANTVTSYATWKTSGSQNGYDGIVFDSGGDVAVMFDGAGNGGYYRQANSRWYDYHNVGNNCTGFGASTTASAYQIYVSGAIYATDNITAYSDRRIKENIITIDKPLTKVEALRGVYYNKINDTDKTKQIGFIAQEVNEVVPELVTYAEDVDQYGVNYGNATALLVEAVKELSQQVKDQQKQIDELKQRLDNDSSN